MRYPVGLGTQQDFDKNWYIATEFGYPESYGFHEGQDINLRTGGDTDMGQPLYAVADGKIVYFHDNSHPTKNFGRHMVLECETSRGKRWYHYAHCQEITAEVKQVKQGDAIGKLGKSGTTYAHLHFAVYKVDPASLPSGIDSIAKTTAQLNTNWEKFELLSPVSSTPTPMPTNDDLNKILTHYNVKTADEFIASNDQQLKFLNEARVEVGVSQEALKKATSDHKNFVSTILGMVNSFGNPAGLSDEDLTIKDVATIRDSVSQLEGKLKEQQEIAEESSRKFAERERDLTNQIAELERKASNLEGQVAELQNDIVKVKQNQQTQQAQTAQNDQFKDLLKGLNGLLKLFKRK